MIPVKNNEIYLYPEFNEIINKLQKNRNLRRKFFEKFNFFLWNDDKPKVASGHQPYIFHAGIWAKIIFLNFFKDFDKIFITNDSDVKMGIFIDIPIYRGKWQRIREYIYLNSENKTFEEYNKDKFDEGIKWFRKKFYDIKDFVKKDIREKIEIFIKNLEENGKPVDKILNARKAFEMERDYKEVKVSWISKDLNFLKFFLYFFYEGEKILEIYNRKLGEFRKIKGIKNEGEPFPYLLKEDDFFEIPFWIIKNGRKRIFKRKNSIYLDGEKIIDLKGKFEEDIERIKIIDLRPRAFTLSIYQRVFLSDFFVHGYGGKKYDEFTDEVFKEIFDIEIPECGFITGTFYIFDGNPENFEEKLSFLSERKNFIIHHPEKFLEKDELLIRKRELIEEIKKGKNKKEVTEKLKEINKKMIEKIGDLILEIEKEIEKIKTKMEEEKVKYFREYPYFYVDFTRIKKAIGEKIDSWN